MFWIIFAVLAPVMFVIYQALSKLLPPGTSIFLINAYASIVGVVLMGILHLIFSANKSVQITSRQLYLAIGIGLFISFGNFFIIKAYSLGAPQASFSAIMYPLLIIFAAITGVFIWHEKINIFQFIGILLSVAGIVMVFYFKNSAPSLI